jgi:hypothetical protein
VPTMGWLYALGMGNAEPQSVCYFCFASKTFLPDKMMPGTSVRALRQALQQRTVLLNSDPLIGDRVE